MADSQEGNITRRQLAGAGLASGAIDRRSKAGHLHRVHRAVYLVGHRARAPRAREFAALLACGKGAVISHRSAARVWSLVPGHDGDEGAEVEVTVVGRRCRSRDGLRVHRTNQLDPLDVRRVDGLLVTAPARTLLDQAASDWDGLEVALSEAYAHRLLRPGELDAAIDRAPSRRGVRVIRALMGAYDSGFTRSEAERRLRRLVHASRLPEPRFNVRILGHEVDALWPERRLILEVDGYGAHGHRFAFERDRSRDAARVAAGFRVIRVTWMQLVQQPLVVVATVGRALGPDAPAG